MEKHCGFLWNSMGLRLRNDTAGGIMSTGMHLDHCRTTQWRLIIWQYWIDWHHDRQRAAKKNTGSLYYLFAFRNLWGQWRQCLFSVIYRLVACPKNLFVNHEFKVGSEVVGVASSQVPVCDYPIYEKKALNDGRSLCACSKTPRLSKTIWTTVTNHIAIRTSALWDWYVRSEKSSQNHVKFVALSSMENMIPARC